MDAPSANPPPTKAHAVCVWYPWLWSVSAVSKASSIAKALISAPAAKPRTQARPFAESRLYSPSAAPSSEDEVVASPSRAAANRESREGSAIAEPDHISLEYINSRWLGRYFCD